MHSLPKRSASSATPPASFNRGQPRPHQSKSANRAGRFPRELVKPMADLGFFGASLKGYGCAGMGQCRIRLDDPGTRARRLRRAQLRQRAIRTLHVPDLRVWQRGAKTDLAASRCRRAKSLAASASPSRVSAPIPAACSHARARSETNTFSTARKCGSPPEPSPMSPSSGQKWKTKTIRFAVFWWKPIAPAFSR